MILTRFGFRHICSEVNVGSMFNWGVVLGGFLFIGLTHSISGQADTSIILSEVLLRGEPLKSKTVGAMQIDLCEKYGLRSASVAQLLEATTNTYVKNYGPGSISSLATRGSAGGHTAVIWNGLSISNPMLGILDFSLLPMAAADDISLQLGSGSSAWGSGAIGGVLSLNNSDSFNEGWRLELDSKVGSFSRFENVAKVEWSNATWSTSTFLMHFDTKNDFRLEQPALSGSSILEHGDVNQSAIIHSLGYKIGEGHLLRLHTWLQSSQRSIPPTTRQVQSVATQSDKALRVMADYQLPTHNGVLQFKLGHFRESLDFFDEIATVDSESSYDISQADATYSFVGLGLNWITSISGMYTTADIKSYDEKAKEWRSTMFLSVERKLGSAVFQLSCRQPIIDGQVGSLIPQFGWSWMINKQWEMRGKISRNFRHPTLNDRYWSPGGNVDLKQEKGWAEELTFLHQWRRQSFKIKTSLTGFHRTIDDWILWAPIESSAFWSATNLGKVNSYGVEIRNDQEYEFKGIELKSNLSYSWTRSINQESLSRPRIKSGQSLYYVPEHILYAAISVDWNRWHLQYAHKYSGQVLGVNKSIPAFDLGNALIAYQAVNNSLEYSLFFRINNIWDRRYEIVEFRPMPGRNFEFGVTINFNE